jgi:cell division protein FtsB
VHNNYIEHTNNLELKMNTRKKIASLFVTATACFVLHTVVAAKTTTNAQTTATSQQVAQQTAK